MQNEALARILGFISLWNVALSTRIVLYSDRLVREWNLQRASAKVVIAHEHFIDTRRFYPRRPLRHRTLAIGFLGRLSPEKGIENLFRALPAILRSHPEARLVVAGDGPLRHRLESIAAQAGCLGSVSFLGWIPREDIPDFLSSLRLLVLPSFTEGLPNVIIEAMACGTPVAATKVGAVPDIVRDEETGFLISSTAPEQVAHSIRRALDFPSLEKVAASARRLVLEQVRYENALARYTRVLDMHARP